MKAAQLVTWRQANKLSQPEAARLLGKSEKTLRRYEKGESPIPETVAAATVALSAPASDVAVAPPFAKGETPWTHPHLFKRAPGKKHRWERIQPGEPLADPEVYREAMAALEAIEAAKPPPARMVAIASCEHCGSVLTPAGDCPWSFCPGNDDDAPEDDQ